MMSRTIQAQFLSAVPVFTANHIDGYNSHRKGLLRYVDDLKNIDRTGRNISNQGGGWQSSANIVNVENDSVKWLLNQFTTFANAAVKNYLAQKMPSKLVPVNGWVNINPRGAWNAPHMHLPAAWSGVFYLVMHRPDIQTCDGNIIFIDPSPFGASVGRDSTIFLPPSEGMMVLFPSYLMHMVSPHQDKEQRISVAVNFDYK